MQKRPLILCVDDEWNGLEGRKMLLEEGGCKVLASTSGVEALRLFALRGHPKPANEGHLKTGQRE